MGHWLKTWVSLGLSVVILTSMEDGITVKAIEMDSADGDTISIVEEFDFASQNDEDSDSVNISFPNLQRRTSPHSLARLFRWLNKPSRSFRGKPYPFMNNSHKKKGPGLGLWGSSKVDAAFPENVEFMIQGTAAVCQKQDTSPQQPCTWRTERIVKNCLASLNKQEPYKYQVKCLKATPENPQEGPDEVSEIMVTSNGDVADEMGGRDEEDPMDFYYNLSRCLGCIFRLI